jgi:hypothetical protein
MNDERPFAAKTSRSECAGANDHLATDVGRSGNLRHVGTWPNSVVDDYAVRLTRSRRITCPTFLSHSRLL